MTNGTHTHHRERLRARFLSSPASFEDHELLELILFYSIPRVNTNETAHRLLDRFGSLKGVLDAPYSSLMGVDGIGPNSALYMRALSELLLRYGRSACATQSPLDSHAALGDLLRSLFVGTTNEICYLLLFDTSKRMLLCEKVSEGYALGNILSTRAIMQLTLANNAAAALIAHNHPNGKAIPSGEDLTATQRLVSMFDTIGVNFIDHFIVAGNECRPIINKDRAELYNLSKKEER